MDCTNTPINFILYRPPDYAAGGKLLAVGGF